MLSVRGATVCFGPKRALDALDLEVAEGEVVAVLGPSGCGKSTLLRAVAGLQDLDAGEIRWSGVDLAGVPVHRRDFGLMFQDHALFSHRDVAANIAFGLKMRRVSRALQSRRVREMRALVGLTGYRARAIATLSGGEAQRVALARTLAAEPRLLMLDEPLGSLDRGLRDDLAKELRALLRELGATVLHVTHDHDEAFAVADRVAVMAAGQIARIGTPSEIWRDPRREDVARFLGHENIVSVSAGGKVDWGSLDAPPGRVVLRSDAFTPAADPKSFTPAADPKPPAADPKPPAAGANAAESGAQPRNQVAGVVADVRFRGDRFELRLRTEPGSVELVVLDARDAAAGDWRRYRIDLAAVPAVIPDPAVVRDPAVIPDEASETRVR